MTSNEPYSAIFSPTPPLDYHPGTMPPYEVGSAADPNIGQEVEGYRIVRQIGHGGMGAVYEAIHDNIGQRTAIKVLFPEFSADVESVGRFVAEARAASQVRHAGLVKVFNHGRFADGTTYIIMEFLAGESLRDRLRRLTQNGQRLPLPDVLRITQQIASALSAVHKEGIVHRDLKPANLILVPDPEVPGGERIKVVDFGIAKFDSGVTTEIGKTTVGRFLGTALYASPEQCQMDGNVDHRADVYALGVILYEMIAGHPPFRAAKPGIVISMHLLVQPPRLYEVVSSVPPQVDQLVHEMLEKDPARRPTMDQILVRVASLKLNGYRWLWWLRRHQRTTASLFGGALLVIGGGSYLHWAHPDLKNTPSPPPPVVAPADMAARQAPDLRQEEPPADGGAGAGPDLSSLPVRTLASPNRIRSHKPAKKVGPGKSPASPVADKVSLEPIDGPEVTEVPAHNVVSAPPPAAESKPRDKNSKPPQRKNDEEDAVH